MNTFNKFILSILILFTSYMVGQTFTHSGTIFGGNGVGISGVPVSLFKRTTTTTVAANVTVKVFSTHGGNGNTSQYGPYPNNLTEMDNLFNTANSLTVLRWSGTMALSNALSWTNANQLSSFGATVPNGGEYFAVEVTGIFTPKETGVYWFGVNSDDAGDIVINNTLVTSYYGGHGMSGPIYGSISLIAGQSYTFKARMQEYGGGEGLAVVWKRPSQNFYTIYADELGGTTTTTTSAWALTSTLTTNTSGVYSFNVASGAGDEFYFTFSTPSLPALSNLDAQEAAKYVVGNSTIRSRDYYRFDTNNDSRFTVSDVYSIFARRNGILSNFQSTPASRIFTPTQWNSINTSTNDTRVSIPGVQTITVNNPTSGGTSNFYLIRVGYTN